MFTYADHIKKLVGIRETYKDALIYGTPNQSAEQ